MKIRSVGSELFHAKGRKEGQTDRQTNMTQLRVTFRNSAYAPKTNIYIKQNTQIYPVCRM
jgi:hypothetical protein